MLEGVEGCPMGGGGWGVGQHSVLHYKTVAQAMKFVFVPVSRIIVTLLLPHCTPQFF